MEWNVSGTLYKKKEILQITRNMQKNYLKENGQISFRSVLCGTKWNNILDLIFLILTSYSLAIYYMLGILIAIFIVIM